MVSVSGPTRIPQELKNEVFQQFKDIDLLDNLMVDLSLEICNMWLSLKSLKGDEGYISINYNDVLNMEFGSILNEFNDKELVNKKREPFEIMERILSLSNTWIKKQGNEIIIKDKNSEEIYEINKYSPMFLINEIARASKNGTPIGIYAVKIKPGPILEKLLIKENKIKDDCPQLPIMTKNDKPSHFSLEYSQYFEGIESLEELHQDLLHIYNKLGLSNRQAAYKIGVSPTTLNKFIKDPSTISEKSVEKIKKFVKQNDNIKNS